MRDKAVSQVYVFKTMSNTTEAGMPFLIIAEDHEGKEIEREAVREAHRAHLASAGKKLLASGAILGGDGKTITGGASLLDTEDEEEARRFERDDPYAQAGIRAKVTILPWRLHWWCGQFSAEGFQSY
ncbi:YciI family protein [Paenirhodobacter populi]|uniref:YCII-related domain-containing protein n=1 Tax=Paenirhodobacter populi TaxID=2306993 RepID=A0A443JEC8_9RHOB|nr:YciI family protein [Sinirhodobacter populi]RWR18831.1 hypothetical protein D2T30_15855 [Sinirhodobacter populi]